VVEFLTGHNLVAQYEALNLLIDSGGEIFASGHSAFCFVNRFVRKRIGHSGEFFMKNVIRYYFTGHKLATRLYLVKQVDNLGGNAALQPSVVRPTLLYISRMLKKVFTCHPERSEGSHVFEKARFFAALRMTIKVKRFMTHYTR
jgi:hypothetical protein